METLISLQSIMNVALHTYAPPLPPKSRACLMSKVCEYINADIAKKMDFEDYLKKVRLGQITMYDFASGLIKQTYFSSKPQLAIDP
jgi:hypothetical protein